MSYQSKESKEQLEWHFEKTTVEVLFKDVKSIHFGVYPPSGHVRVSAPHTMDKTLLKLAVIQRLGWIRTQQASFEKVERETPRQFVDGESHYIFGKRYRLKVRQGLNNEVQLEKNFIVLTLRGKAYDSLDVRKQFMESWFKLILAKKVIELCQEKNIMIDSSSISIRKMRTKWFGALPEPQRAWININLVREPEKLILKKISALVRAP